jgi:tetratricopeptide (TPR) repeat protein
MGLGAALEKQGMLAEALTEYERGVQLAPHDAQNRLIFAHLAERLGAYERARAAYESAISQDGGEVEARKRLADLQESGGHLDQAAAVLTDAIKVFPSEQDLRVRLAEVRYRQKQYSSAETILQSALKTAGSHRARAHYLMAFLEYHKGHLPTALNELDSAITLSPDMADAYYQRGEIYVAMGRNDLAKQSYAKAIQIRGAYTDALLAIQRLEDKANP